MQNFAKFISLKKIPGSAYVKQGVKGGKTPKNAIHGGNGSFIVYDRAQIILILEYDGKRYSKDIYYDIKKVTSKRITDNFCSKLKKAFASFKFTVENDKFNNINDAIEYAINS